MFFTFDQNNSGGYFEQDEVATINVVIEADNYKEANQIASNKGLFSYSWCECCGERFHRQWDDSDGRLTPMKYNQQIYEVDCMWVDAGEVVSRVFYKDGSVDVYTKQDDNDEDF